MPDEAKAKAPAQDAGQADAQAPEQGQAEGQAPAQGGQAEGQQQSQAQSEWFIPGKFRTPEDLWKAYQELEKELTRLYQERSKWQKGARGSAPPVPEDLVELPEDEAILQKLPKDPAERRRFLIEKQFEDPVEAQRMIQAIVRAERRARLVQAASNLETVIADLMTEMPDLSQHTQALTEFFGSNPELQSLMLGALAAGNHQQAKRLLASAYYAVKGRSAEQMAEQARQQALQEMAEKQKAQAIQAPPSPPQKREPTEEEIIRDYKRSILAASRRRW